MCDVTPRFSRVINWKRREIGLNVNGVWTDESSLVKQHIKAFFEKKFEIDLRATPRLDGITFNQLSQADNNALTASFELDEIKEEVWDCGGDKSPGPDGYNFKFIKEFWHLFQHDIKKVMDDFYANGAWPRGSNASFMALIPKVDTPLGLNDFRPISLVG